MEEEGLTPIQVEVARIFFDLDASRGFLLAGGAALLASELIARPTDDLDFFASAPIAAVTQTQEALASALGESGFQVSVVQGALTFCRMVVERGEEAVLVDLAIDSPPAAPPTLTMLGPTLTPLELAGRKLLALFGRAEARDFADVFVLAQRFTVEDLLRQAARVDAGFDTTVLAQMMRTIGRFSDDEIPLASSQIHQAREFYRQWAEDLQGSDDRPDRP